MRINSKTSRLKRLRSGAGSILAGGLLGSLVTTGLVGVVAHPKPVLDSRVQTLTEAPADPGFDKQVDTGLPTEMVGFEWTGGAGAVNVRVRNGSSAGSWVQLDSNVAEGPDKTSREFRGRTTAGPVWIGKGVQSVQVHVVAGHLSSLKLHAIRTEPAAPSGGIEGAGALPPDPGIISRASWGADESFRNINPDCSQPVYSDTVRFAVVHHTDGSNDYAPADSAAIVRGIYYFHTHTNGWCDIGYNFLVDKYGQIFEGRYGGPDRPVVGAHAMGWNEQSTGAALIGNYQSTPLSAAAFSSLRALLSWKLALTGVNPSGTIQQNGQTIQTIIGHRDVNSTDCPGDQVYALLPQLRTAVTAGYSALKVYSANSAKALDMTGGSIVNGTPVEQWTAHGGFNQQWSFQPVGPPANGIYRIINVNSGKALDVSGGSTADGAAVIQWTPQGGTNQQWKLVLASSTTYEIVSVNSGKVLDVAGGSTADGARVFQWTAHGGPNQQWQLALAV